ncbi:MAG TPA: EAL domain-containing protein [Bradyrhizobium sp.]|nr:EAL domain-containing protein [Bradyrhizobium sp.]
MIRISTIFIAICMVLVAASLGLVLYSVAGMNGMEAAIIALTALTFLILYNAVSMRLRDRTDVGSQITDLSRGTADLARQIAEFSRRIAAIEGRLTSANQVGAERIQVLVGEINELGGLVKQLAVSVASHEDILSAVSAPPTAPAAGPAVSDDPSAAEPTAAEPPKPTVASPPVLAVVNGETGAAAQSKAQMLATVTAALEENRLDIYLQPMVTLPQRKVRFYEAVTRIRDEHNRLFTADDFIPFAEAADLIGQVDHAVMLRCIQVLRRLMVRNKEVGVFYNMAAATLSNPATFAPCLDFLEANRALAPSFIIEFKQAVFRDLGPTESEHLAALAQRGYRFSIDHVSDLRIEPRELADRGVRFIKVPAALLLDPKASSTSDIHPSDLSDLLGRFGIDLIAERIEGERAVVDLLDFDVRFGQGFLFAPPRPVRPEAAGETASANKAREANGAVKTPAIDPVAVAASTRLTGNAALARRAAAGPA